MRLENAIAARPGRASQRRGPSSITWKILWALILMAATGLGGGAYAVSRHASTTQLYANLIDHEARSMRRISRAAVLAIDDSRLLLRLLIEAEPIARERLLGERDLNQQHVYASLREAAALVPRLQAPIHSFAEQFSVLAARSIAIEDMAMAGDVAGAARIIHTERDPAFVELRRQMRGLVQQLENEMRAASAAATRASRQTMWRTLGVLGGGAFLSLLLAAWLLRRNVTRPLLEMEARMRALQAGDLFSPVPGRERPDEVGGMAAALEGFRLAAIDKERLDEAARTDPLTGLLNRRGITARIDELFRQAAPMTAIAIDLDHFKQTNDLHGHAAGDALLVAVAQRLQGAVRAGDLVGRLGGDEFILVLGGTPSPRDLDHVAARISHLLHRPVTHESGILRLGATLGVAVATAAHRNAAAVLRQADDLLMEAKQRQRGSIGRLGA